MAKNKRFEVISSETPRGGFAMNTTVLMDTATGVLYLLVSYGEGSGLTPLLGPDGKPQIWSEGCLPREGWEK